MSDTTTVISDSLHASRILMEQLERNMDDFAHEDKANHPLADAEREAVMALASVVEVCTMVPMASFTDEEIELITRIAEFASERILEDLS